MNLWLTTEEETFDWSKTYFVYTPNDKFGDLKGLRNIGENNVEKKISYKDEGDQTIVTVELENKDDKIAFFIEMQINNKDNNQSILLVICDDKYVRYSTKQSTTYTPTLSKKQNSKLEVVLNS